MTHEHSFDNDDEAILKSINCIKFPSDKNELGALLDLYFDYADTETDLFLDGDIITYILNNCNGTDMRDYFYEYNGNIGNFYSVRDVKDKLSNVPMSIVKELESEECSLAFDENNPFGKNEKHIIYLYEKAIVSGWAIYNKELLVDQLTMNDEYVDGFRVEYDDKNSELVMLYTKEYAEEVGDLDFDLLMDVHNSSPDLTIYECRVICKYIMSITLHLCQYKDSHFSQEKFNEYLRYDLPPINI